MKSEMLTERKQTAVYEKEQKGGKTKSSSEAPFATTTNFHLDSLYVLVY